MTKMRRNFGGLEDEFSDYENSRVAILPIPYEGTVSYGHCASKGPAAIIDASMHMELYDEELACDTYKIGIHTLPQVEAAHSHSEIVKDRIKEGALKPLKDGKFLASIGGEHSVTNGILEAFVGIRGKDFGVLQLDAHADLRDNYGGTPFSHACIMRRVDDMGLQYCQVGIRSMSREEADFVAEKGRKIHFAHKIIKNDKWMDDVMEELPERIYVTIDIDCLDTSIMPSTGTPEPGGLDWYTTTAFLRKVAESRDVIGLDLVELAPFNGFHAPDFLAAKLLYKMLGYIFKGQIKRLKP